MSDGATMNLPLDLIFEILTFLFLVATTVAVSNIVEHFSSQRRRLGQGATQLLSSHTSLLKGRNVSNPFLLWVQSSTSIGNSKERQKLARELADAGYNSPTAPAWYVIIRFSLAIGLPLSLLLSNGLAASPIKGSGLILWPLLTCGIGLLVPSVLVGRHASARRAQLEREFPDALDLMVVCVEAGLSLDASFVRVSDEIGESHPRIAEEFARVSAELRAGQGLAEALRAMADRSGVSGVKAFAALVIQTEALGVSVAQTLRTYSVEMRETRFYKAEEKAMRIPVLMTIPLVICILPVIITAVMLPVIIDLVRTILPILTHQGAG
jgi:tight adherence protein C